MSAPQSSAIRRAADFALALVAIGLPLSTTVMQVGAVALAVLAMLSPLAGRSCLRRTPLDVPIGVLFGVLALSTLASLRPLEAVGWARVWVVITYFGVYWWLRDAADARRFFTILAVAGIGVAAYGVVQHFTGIDLYRGALGRPLRVRPRTPDADGFAVVGFFRNYLTFAHGMLLPLAIAATRALRTRRPPWIVGATVIVLAIVFSTARGAWLGAVAVIAVAMRLAGGVRVGRIAAGLVLVGLAAIAVSPARRAQVRHLLDLRGENAARVAIYRANLAIVHDHPVLGLGFGRYATAARPYYEREPAADRRSHAHSNYLHLAAEAGLVGLGAFCLLFAVGLRTGWPRAPGGVDAEAVASLVGFLVGGLTQYTFGDNEVAIGMWAALAVLARAGKT